MELVQFVVVLLQLTFFGIFVAFNPLLLASQLLIVIRSKRPVFFTAIFIIGASLPLVLIAFAGTRLFNSDTVIQPFNTRIELSPIINALIGFVMILISVRLFILEKHPKDRIKPSNTKGTMQTSALFWFAFFRSALSFTSIIGIVAATKVLKDYTDNYILILLGLFWTISVGMLPFLGIVGYSIRRPDNLKTLEQKIDPVLNKNYKKNIKWLLLIVGAYFILRSITS